MPAIDRVRIAREIYGAYESGNREMVEKHLSQSSGSTALPMSESTYRPTGRAAGRTRR
jgi:hypothetical protein